MKRGFWHGFITVLFLAPAAGAVMGGGDITIPAEGAQAVLFSHEVHVGRAKQKCADCHYGLYTNHAQRKVVGMAGMRNGRSCGACHNGQKAFSVASSKNCARCHS